MSVECMMIALGRTDIRGDDRLALFAAADNGGKVSLGGIMSWVGCNYDEAVEVFQRMERAGEFVCIDVDYYALGLMDAETIRKLRNVCKGRAASQALRDRVFARDGRQCRYCKDEAGPFQLDHVLPWSRGGETSLDNLVVCCAVCNAEKRDRTPEEMGRTL